MDQPPPPDLYCLLWIDSWFTCMTKYEWATWAQAVFSVLAVLFAALYPLYRHSRRERKRLLETVAIDVLLTERQARVLLEEAKDEKKAHDVPAYRLPLLGWGAAMPTLSGQLAPMQSAALVQFYVDARSMNYCLDLAQGAKDNARDWKHHLKKARLKASHLVPGDKHSRYDRAIEALKKAGLREKSLRQIPLRLADKPTEE